MEMLGRDGNHPKERIGEPGEGWGALGETRIVGRDGEPREGLGLQREAPERTETSVRDVDPVGRWEPTKNGEARKAGDAGEGQKPQGMMGTPRRAEPFLPLCHTGLAPFCAT